MERQKKKSKRQEKNQGKILTVKKTDIFIRKDQKCSIPLEIGLRQRSNTKNTKRISCYHQTRNKNKLKGGAT